MTRRNLPPDPDCMNEARSMFAAKAVIAYRNETKTDEGDALCDLLCDLMHWSDERGIDFKAEFARAAWHYNEETGVLT